jgi:nicotinamidase-related amidase
MIMRSNHSLVWLVDVQERLLPAIDQGDSVASACAWLADVAAELEVPVAASEQYPKGLGHTVANLEKRLDPGLVLEKTHFSCADAGGCLRAIQQSGRHQVILGGIEAHVCVLQTGLGLKRQGYEVYVVSEAVGSRCPEDKRLALDRLRDNGVSVVSGEMVAFEWLHQAGTDAFKRVTKGYIS